MDPIAGYERRNAVEINRPVVGASITRRDKMRKLAFRRQIQLGYGHLRLVKIPVNDEWIGGYLRLFCQERLRITRCGAGINEEVARAHPWDDGSWRVRRRRGIGYKVV